MAQQAESEKEDHEHDQDIARRPAQPLGNDGDDDPADDDCFGRIVGHGFEQPFVMPRGIEANAGPDKGDQAIINWHPEPTFFTPAWLQNEQGCDPDAEVNQQPCFRIRRIVE